MEKQKKMKLDQRCLEIINRNESLNSLFDEVSAIHKEAEEHYKIKILSTISKKQKEHFELQWLFFAYLFSLLEDIHRYSYLALCEVALYEKRLEEKEDRSFFSSRYFLSNASVHIIGAWERTFRLSGILYGHDFTKGTQIKKIYQELKKKDEFKDTEVFLQFKKLREDSNHLPDIEDFRKGNDHGLSSHVKFEKDDDLKKLANSCYENGRALYEIIQFYIFRFQNECFLRRSEIDLRNFGWDLKIDPAKLDAITSIEFKRELLPARIHRCREYITGYINAFLAIAQKTGPFLTKYDENSIYILQHSDVIWRLSEANNSLGYAYSLMTKAVKKNKELNELEIYYRNMDYAYYIESAISRIYSVYDKIAILLHIHTGEGGRSNTFEQFIKRITDENLKNELLAIAKNIFEREEYQELNQLRQINFHYIVKENFIHIVDREWSHSYNMVMASKNIEILEPLITKIMDYYLDDPVGMKMNNQ
ncbi:hypothetical protein JDW19_02465 [Paenibacillus polymyxa]|uniref:LA2681-like HEPN domain-containing protein n=1 Tax=Paenibacillus polymyxa TaxID=1406 RepID=A0A8I1LTV8_PAEPO|nr:MULTISPECIES: Cthe_2314 family HEPN domain-containing protein [Paenibacillus]KAF6576563.1 hypothetical protein G9G53_01230 [Paenibacillus sp. EKM206P]KAF6591303.1 hypothetical protein G9G52_02735 [Paenibacillus sp. EKM205P]MBM0631992.1 hypothetical protein [Paenibacillus polymyxa]